MVRSLRLPHHRHTNWIRHPNGRSETSGGSHMSPTFPIRSIAAIVSTALALGTAAPAASANRAHRALAARAATSNTASWQPCSPFVPTLQICAIGPGGVAYGAGGPSAPIAPTAQPTGQPPAQPTPVRVVAHDGGFDWGYGAIGVATLVLVGIGVGGVRVATNNRARHAATS
jgi:hypothetical protein